jgi:ferric-dicitrate binding protein FerR (iron transport regulator)
MDQNFSQERLQYLWKRWMSKTASEEEVEELFAAIRANGNNMLPEPQTVGPFQGGLDDEKKAFILQTILDAKPVVKVRHIRYVWYAAASVVIIMLGAMGYLYMNRQQIASNVQPVIAATATDIQPGTQRAILTLSDGSTIVLDSASNGVIAKQGHTSIVKNASGEILYNADEKPSGKILYNTMSTPRGGMYSLVLPDGSKVWLNAASSITYPTRFAGNTREVAITGEAYFEVTKNPLKAFIVKTYKEEISVHGTSFNVNSYRDEQNVRTSLLEGSVFIGAQELKPGEVYQNGKVFKADVNLDVAWKNGSFAFSNADLKSVMRQLARWYNLEIVFEGEIPPGKFSGEIGRTLTLNQLLKGLSITKIKYRLENGNKLIIISDKQVSK